MRAVVCTGYGDAADVLATPDDLPPPEPGPGEVVVRVRAASVNPIDARKRRGYGRALFERGRSPLFPWILGGDLAGVVEAAGPGATRFERGDAVIGAPGPFAGGTHAERVAIRARDLAPAPAGLSFVESAAIPYSGLTAWSALTRAAGLRPGDGRGRRALVNGASGGVGHLAVQILAAWGWRVAATCSADAVEMVAGLGAEEVVDHRAENFADRLSGLDLVLDAVGEGVAGMEARALSVVSRRGRYATLVHPLAGLLDRHGVVPGGAAAAALFAARTLRAAPRRYGWALFKPDGEALSELSRLAESGALTPVIDRVTPATRAAEAHEAIERGGVRGKVVLAFDDAAALRPG